MSERQPNRVEFVIQKYRLSETTYIEAEEAGKKLGQGRLMSEACLNHFVELDPSGNLKYLDWMLFQAGGGQEAMEKSLGLWEGEGDADPNSLRNQCRQDFIEEQVQGYTDEDGVKHRPVSREEATLAWKTWEDRSKFEFVMGDQDVSMEEGFGFHREWPGKNGHYQKIVNVVKLWHSAQPKLVAQNQRYERWEKLKNSPPSLWNEDDRLFMRRCQENAPTGTVVLDIYAGWKPKEYSQTGAIYKNIDDLLRTLADVRKMQVLRDVRFDKIYEDDNVSVVCPLTIGAAIKFGIGKWCVCNRTEFDRYFEAKGASDGNWQRYCKQGPLVFMTWKVPMPPYLHRIALCLPREQLRHLGDSFSWVDCSNQQTGTSHEFVLARIQGEHTRMTTPPIEQWGSSSDERYYMWGGRNPGPAWKTVEVRDSVLRSLDQVLQATRRWAASFRMERIVLDFITDAGSLVDSK